MHLCEQNIPGTTRDVVDTEINVRGVCLRLLDTAGIREATDEVEKIGVKRSEAAVQSADIALFVINGEEGWTAADEEIFERVWRVEELSNDSPLAGPMVPIPTLEEDNDNDQKSGEPPPGILVVNKSDKSDAVNVLKHVPEHVTAQFHTKLATSALQGVGVLELQVRQLCSLVCSCPFA